MIRTYRRNSIATTASSNVVGLLLLVLVPLLLVLPGYGFTASSSQCDDVKITTTDEVGRRKRISFMMGLRMAADGSEMERKPWDIFRFVQQSSKFVDLPFPNLSTTPKTKRIIERGDCLWKAGDDQNEFTFAPLDDVVMGGASKSNFDSNTGQWRGEVTDANNGGFIGIRSTPLSRDYDMTSCQGIELLVATSSSSSSRTNNKSDDKLRLKIVIRDSTEFNGIGWTTSVDVMEETKGEGGSRRSNTLRVPFSKQIPTRFAQRLSGNSDTFNKDQVKGFQLVYSKFEYDGDFNPTFNVGNFQLQVIEIRAF